MTRKNPPRKAQPPQKTRKKKTARAAKLVKTHLYEVDANPVHVYLSRLGEGSARVMASALASIADILSGGKVVAEALAWHEIRPEHVSALRGRLQKLYAPATANRYLAALRAVLKETWRLGLMERETIERALDVPPVKGSREPRGRAVSIEEIKAVFAACAADDNGAAGARDAAVLALLYGSGLRRAEAATLELKDLEDSCLQVSGKGDKARVVFLPAGTLRAIEAWLAVRGSNPGPLFCHVTRFGKVRHQHVSPQLIYRIVQKRHLTAGIDTFTPHDLRRSHISTLLDEGVDLATVSREVGHSNVQTTARYDRRTERALQDAASRMEVPFE